jgi:hypothetical protein
MDGHGLGKRYCYFVVTYTKQSERERERASERERERERARPTEPHDDGSMTLNNVVGVLSSKCVLLGGVAWWCGSFRF